MSMDVIRLWADATFFLSLLILPFKIFHTKSCAGISAKTQFLLALTYIARYLDVFSYHLAAYVTTMKIIIPAITISTLILIYLFRKSYDRNNDTFRLELILIPTGVLALNFNHMMTIEEVLWAFSIYTEAVAVLPQIFMLAKTKSRDEVIYLYLFIFGWYRGLYVIHWIYQVSIGNYYDTIALAGGITHVIVCFGWYFIRKLFSYMFVDKNIVYSASNALLGEKEPKIFSVLASPPEKQSNPVVHI